MDTDPQSEAPPGATGHDGQRRVDARAALADVERTSPARQARPDRGRRRHRRARFGGLTAVDVEHVEIQRGVITALIGPNGAGKTTFFNLLTGFDKPDEGSWSFNGKCLKGVPAYKVARLGMVRTFQLTKVLSQAHRDREHAARRHRPDAARASGRRCSRRLWRGAGEGATPSGPTTCSSASCWIKKREDFAGSLSGGQRKLLEMARALMVDPELVMLDEPMAGVNPALKQSLLGHVKSLRDEGRTVLFVEHDMDMVRDISDWVIVMAQGKIIAEGPPDAVMADQRVIDAYLGAHHDTELSFEEEEKILAEAEAEIEPSREAKRAMTRREPRSTTPEREAPPRGGRRRGPARRRPDRRLPARASTSSTAPTSTARRASWSASSAPTAPASRRCSRRCSGWSRSATGTVHAQGRGHHQRARRRAGHRRASASCRRPTTCSRR